MIPQWAQLDERERAVFQTTVTFLKDRLAESDTVNWALHLKPSQQAERTAIEYLLERHDKEDLREPWGTSWRLIEDCWSGGEAQSSPSTAIHLIRDRFNTGDRSGKLISAIVDLVSPRLIVEPLDQLTRIRSKIQSRPKTFRDLMYARITSGDLIDLDALGLSEINDISFLMALGHALEGAVNRGHDIARRIGWDYKNYFRLLAEVRRVYYLSSKPRGRNNDEPDSFNRGIAPSVKLLDAIISQIATIDAMSAYKFIQRWRVYDEPMYTRLWASLSRNSKVVSGEDVEAFLSDLDNDVFWNLHMFPEVAELRARRFTHLSKKAQRKIVRRLRDGPPRTRWPRDVEPDKIETARRYWVARELRRIQIAGNEIGDHAQGWLQGNFAEFPDLAEMTIDEGFPGGPIVEVATPKPDNRFDVLSGLARLRALEEAFASTRGGWDDDPAERAAHWLRRPGKSLDVLSDLEAADDKVSDFPHVWERFGWVHSPPASSEINIRDANQEADRALNQMMRLCDETALSAIEGISHWLSTWRNYVVTKKIGLDVWFKIWPLSIKATDTLDESEAPVSFSISELNDNEDLLDLDTLNTPAGRLVTVFMAACPNLNVTKRAFSIRSRVRKMRDTVIGATGRSGLIARHRLTEFLPYFLLADRDWAQEQLIAPLLNDDAAALNLWRAVARRPLGSDILMTLGHAMADRVTDRRLGRETRRSLVFYLVVETLHALRDRRAPAVPYPRITQMLRSLDDEVRAEAAEVVQQFVRELSAKERGVSDPQSAAEIFRSSAAPFLRDVWPQERSLVTPGVARAFAELPAASGSAFTDAFEAVARFLAPFDCWSMADFGLFGEADGIKKLSIVDDESKANAFLKLLSLTIGTSEGAVVPIGLSGALDQVKSVAPNLAQTPEFRRLSAAARR